MAMHGGAAGAAVFVTAAVIVDPQGVLYFSAPCTCWPACVARGRGEAYPGVQGSPGHCSWQHNAILAIHVVLLLATQVVCASLSSKSAYRALTEPSSEAGAAWQGGRSSFSDGAMNRTTRAVPLSAIVHKWIEGGCGQRGPSCWLATCADRYSYFSRESV
jgi:hypothetical protein